MAQKYRYNGKIYKLPDGLSRDEALKRIRAHEAKSNAPQLKPQQERGLIDRARDWITGVASDMRIRDEERAGLREAGVGLVPTTREELAAAALPTLPIVAGMAGPAQLALGVAGGEAGARLGAAGGRRVGEAIGPGVGDIGESAGALAGGIVGGGATASIPSAGRAAARGVTRAAPEVGRTATAAASGARRIAATEGPAIVGEGVLDAALSVVPGGSFASGIARRGLRSLIKRAAPTAERQAETGVARGASSAERRLAAEARQARRAAEKAAKAAQRQARLHQQAVQKRLQLKARELALKERRMALAEEKARVARERAGGGTAKPETPQTEGALALKAEILPDGQRAMATNLGGPARPGPAPTPDAELEGALRQSLRVVKKRRPSDASMSSYERSPAPPTVASDLEGAMPKGEGPGSIPFALGKRARGPGDIPQMEELMGNIAEISQNPEIPVALGRRLLAWLEAATKPDGRMMGRETGVRRATIPRRKLLEEYIDIMKSPEWEQVFGSDELLRHGQKLELKLDALRQIEKATRR